MKRILSADSTKPLQSIQRYQNDQQLAKSKIGQSADAFMRYKELSNHSLLTSTQFIALLLDIQRRVNEGEPQQETMEQARQ